MTKHTPGPWMIDPKYLSEIQTADDKTICSAWHQHASGQEIVVTGVLECSLEESAANAKLIAAAPDLLEVLKAFVDETVDYATINKLGDPEKQHNVKWARQVIAKATA